MKKISTVFEMGDQEIRGFQGERGRGTKRVLYYDVRMFPEGDSESAGEILREMTASMPVYPRAPVLLLPRRRVILRQMRLPSHDRSEIEDMIGLQLINNLPYGIEEIIYRFQVLGQGRDSYSLVLVLVASRGMIEEYSRIMCLAGIRDGRITVSSFGIAQWLTDEGGELPSPVALVHVGAQTCEVCFCRPGRLYYSRDIDDPGNPITFCNREELLRQTVLSLELYRLERLGPEVKEVQVLSAGCGASDFSHALSEATGLPVKCLDPSRNVRCSPAALKAAERDGRASSTAAWLGSLFAGTGELVDLLCHEKSDRHKGSKGRHQVATLCVLVLMVMALVATGSSRELTMRKERLRSTEEQIGDLQAQWRDAVRTSALVRSVEDHLKQYRFVPGLLSGLTGLTPEGIAFRQIVLDEGDHVELQGYAGTHAAINDFQSRLSRSPEFGDVDLQFATNRKIAGTSVIDFKIALRLTGAKREEQ